MLWDLPDGVDSAAKVTDLAKRYGVRAGAINPNVFQDQHYKYGSLGNPDPAVREVALQHLLDSAEIGDETGQPRRLFVVCGRLQLSGHGQYSPAQKMVRRRAGEAARAPLDDQRMLVEYKPFEPAFYHTDIGDWGMALSLARSAGPKAKVLVDTGHHYQGQNIEQIVAWLLADNMLGGFHFNDRRYADDDLTLGSIDPYQVFRIFHEIRYFEWETGSRADIAYMIDQSHNLKGKIEAMIQTVLGRAGTLREGRYRGSRALGGISGEIGARGRRELSQGRVFDGCAARDSRMGPRARLARRSAGRVSPERLSRAHHRGAK